jgi:hypothetical protein
MERRLRNRAVQTYLRFQTSTQVDRVDFCYIENLNSCCVTGNKSLDSSRHALNFPMYKEWSFVMLNETDCEHTSTNGMIRVLSLIQFVDNFDTAGGPPTPNTRAYRYRTYIQVICHE